MLCAIEPGSKAPTYKEWNALGLGQIKMPPGYGAGLMHVESGTCAIDLDQMEIATAWLAQKSVDLASLLTAPDAVRIASGRTGRAKLLYRLDRPLQSVKTAKFQQISPKSGQLETYTAIDFRCATKGGLSMQDVLPPTIHPDTGKPYEWAYGDELTGSWRNLPPLPPELRAIWEELLRGSQIANDAPAAPTGAGFEEMRALLAQQDPNAAYNEWLRVGMALHHETSGSREGLLLWNEWSARATGPDKYKGIADLEPHWRSFNTQTAGAVTLGSLRAEAVADVGDFPIVLPSTSATTPEGRRKFQRRPFEVFIAGKPPEWIIDGVLPAGTLGVIYGPSGSGKSFLASDMGLHVADGRAWRGFDTKRTEVTYLIAEGVPGSRQRLSAARDAFGFDVSGFDIVEDTPNLLDKTDPPALARELRAPREDGAASKIGLVIVDTLAQTIPGGDENAGKDMSVVLEHCKLIHQATGAMVLLIAHTGKDETRGMRGWSGVKGALDFEMEVSELADGLRVAAVTKLKDGEDGAKYAFRLRHVDDGTKRGTLVVEHTDEEPRTKVTKRSNAPPVVHFHTICVERLGVGIGVETDFDDVMAEVMNRIAVAPGDYEKCLSTYRRVVNTFLATPECPFILRGGAVRLKDAPEFPLQPVGQAGIDAEPPKPQDHSDLLGVPAHG